MLRLYRAARNLLVAWTVLACLGVVFVQRLANEIIVLHYIGAVPLGALTWISWRLARRQQRLVRTRLKTTDM